MPIEITIPRLGWSMDEGIFLGWLKRDGDAISPGDALFQLEGEKAVQDIEAIDAGILRIPPHGPKDGDVLPVGAVIGFLAERGEAIEFKTVSSGARVLGATGGLSAPEDSETAGTGSKLPVAPESSEKRRSTEHRVTISPRARRVAQELGVDWANLVGTGSTGRIRERDVRAAKPTRPAAVKLTGTSLRHVIARRMSESTQQAASVTLHTTIDATRLVAVRQEFKRLNKNPREVTPSYSDIFVKMVAASLRQHPYMNARWTEQGPEELSAVHVGIAVDTDAGLMVPVVKDPLSLRIKELARRSTELIEKARERKLSADQLQGGTFTISNLGAFGIDAFTPVINLPEAAILGLGRIIRRPAAVDDKLFIRDEMTLSLTFDHRIVDGAPAARFLQTIARLIENLSLDDLD
ncbi:MAG: dihydrolipoamide acetyltransferase family protein [Planctomycetaceae bacterium]